MIIYRYAFDLFIFVRCWLANPWVVGAIAPSSESLARLITKEVVASAGPVLELGAGTGIFTEQLLGLGVREQDVTLVEFGADFAANLKKRFPHAQIVQMDAVGLAKADLSKFSKFGSVISGLPMLAMRPRKVMAILSGAFEHMTPTAGFYQFTYLPRCPIPRRVLDRLGLKATRVGRTFLNMPPAAVYRITRRQPYPTARRLPLPNTQGMLNTSALALHRHEVAL